ncbi:lytic transglycosylase domain-containing protein [Bradyrhizobium erythrophlei]|uniref:lytic transglycosylase domain-containing protein n=1 Tax=Bradyrhizobium erythrophlei TaxID=1437360 RepID=UPI0035E6DD69
MSSVEEPDPDEPRPLALEPFAPRRLTAADMPPSNPLSAGYAARTSAMFGRDWRAGRAEYRALVEREALIFGLPPALVDAVMAVESRYNSAAVGMDGEVGLMQVMLPTARMLGFSGTPAELAVPEVNVHYGTRYLAGAWRLAGGDLCTATMKYRAGHGETRFSFLSVDYCVRVRAHLAANGVPVTGSVPLPTFGSPAGGGRARGGALSASAAVNFAALNTRLRSLAERKSSSASP